jgi:hypothetical protein
MPVMMMMMIVTWEERRRCEVAGVGSGYWVARSKMAIGSSFHVKITKITNCPRSQITNRGSQKFCDFCDRQFVILGRTENGMNSRFFCGDSPSLEFVAEIQLKYHKLNQSVLDLNFI